MTFALVPIQSKTSFDLHRNLRPTGLTNFFTCLELGQTRKSYNYKKIVSSK
jgi:hypothetical protein